MRFSPLDRNRCTCEVSQSRACLANMFTTNKPLRRKVMSMSKHAMHDGHSRGRAAAGAAMLLCAIASGAVPVAGAAAQGTAPLRAMDAYIETLARDAQVSGTVLVASGSDVVYEKSFGYAEYGRSKNTPETLFAVASVTKSLTGMATRALVARGVLRLEDPISKWIPDFPSANSITVGHLLSHRAGIPHRVTQPQDEQAAQTAESMVRLAERAGLVLPPGTQRLYSSTGYSVLARVLELAAGKPYSQLLRERVLAPAGANGVVDATEPFPNGARRAVGYFATPGGPTPAATKSLSFLVGAGSVWATPRDLFKIVRRVVDGGYGTAAAGARDERGTVAWNGFSNGSMAVVHYDPVTKTTIIVTSNLLTGAIDWIVRDVPRILAGEAVAAPSAPVVNAVALSPERRRQLEGTYNYFGNQQQLSFLSPSAALLGGEYLFVATGDTALYAPQNYADYAVVSDSSGQVSAIQLRAPNGLSIARVRIPDDAARRNEVLAVVQRFLDAMRAKDTAGMRAVFEPSARFVGMRRRATGDTTISNRSVSDFISQVAGDPRPWIERTWSPEVRIDHSLATVWAEFDFYTGSTFGSCGVDAVQLLRTPAGWRIVNIADSLRAAGCTVRPPPTP